MDLRLYGSRPLRHGVNGGTGRNSRQEDDSLQFLSQEEQECLRFFEDTIGSLEASLEENDFRQITEQTTTSQGRAAGEADGPRSPSPTPGAIVASPLARPLRPKDQDIIDLVRPELDMVQPRETIFDPMNPDFQSLAPTPASHVEMKPKRDPAVGFPPGYSPLVPTDSHHPPPGSVPTPALIAQKIAESQAGGASSIDPSTLLRRFSQDSEMKQGPPSFGRPNRFPVNVNMILGNKDSHNPPQSNVNVQERRGQVLTNLTGSHHRLRDPRQNPENIPRRSISFKDPSPDKSRTEALSKLGLSRSRAMSGGQSLLSAAESTSLDRLAGAKSRAEPVGASGAPVSETRSKLPEAGFANIGNVANVANVANVVNVANVANVVDTVTPPLSQINVDRRADASPTLPLSSNETRNLQWSPPLPAATESITSPPPVEEEAPASPPPEVTSLEFNSYGGKSLVVNPSLASKVDLATSPVTHEPRFLSSALAHSSQFNSFGGKSKVVAPVPVNRGDLPDILSSHIDKSHTPPPKTQRQSPELNRYGGKSRAIDAAGALNRPLSSTLRNVKAPAPAPKPSQHSYHGSAPPPRAAPTALSPERKQRSGSMFRPQSITVHFSGRNGTEESRRDALRKLGLLKDS
ncbi:specifically androgen-regulated gene protein [Brachionichthys hirsutus]|uniref:specifically androgen-regulated gene protein n=1 Tax=Brachionichthys hirsutus TaxID=412623 RepID=UPI0036043B52